MGDSERSFEMRETVVLESGELLARILFWTPQGPAYNAKKKWVTSRSIMSSLRRGHANLLCIVPILTDDPNGSTRPLLGGPFIFCSAGFLLFLWDKVLPRYKHRTATYSSFSYSPIQLQLWTIDN